MSVAKTLEDLHKSLEEFYHELKPRRRYNAMRNAMRNTARYVRRQVTDNMSGLSYRKLPRHKGRRPKKGNRLKSLKKNVVAVEYRRAVGFHVTITGRGKKGGGKFDHINSWGKPVPAARWFETGTKKQEPRPFLEPVKRRVEPQLMQLAKKRFDEQIDKIIKKIYG